MTQSSEKENWYLVEYVSGQGWRIELPDVGWTWMGDARDADPGIDSAWGQRVKTRLNETGKLVLRVPR